MLTAMASKKQGRCLISNWKIMIPSRGGGFTTFASYLYHGMGLL